MALVGEDSCMNMEKMQKKKKKGVPKCTCLYCTSYEFLLPTSAKMASHKVFYKIKAAQFSLRTVLVFVQYVISNSHYFFFNTHSSNHLSTIMHPSIYLPIYSTCFLWHSGLWVLFSHACFWSVRGSQGTRRESSQKQEERATST